MEKQRAVCQLDRPLADGTIRGRLSKFVNRPARVTPPSLTQTRDDDQPPVGVAVVLRRVRPPDGLGELHPAVLRDHELVAVAVDLVAARI